MMGHKITQAFGVLGVAWGSATAILASLSAKDLSDMVIGLATSLAGAALILLPAYVNWRTTRREQDLKDSEVRAKDLQIENERLKGRIDSLAGEMTEWRLLAQSRSPSIGPSGTSISPPPRGTD